MLRTNYALAALSTLNQIRFVLGTEDLNGLDLLPLRPCQNAAFYLDGFGRILGIRNLWCQCCFVLRLLIYIQCGSC